MNNFLNLLWLKLTLEPVAALDILKQVLNLLIVFSLVHWSAEQLAAVNLVLGLFLGFITRQTVTPNPKVDTVKTHEQIKEDAKVLQSK